MWNAGLGSQGQWNYTNSYQPRIYAHIHAQKTRVKLNLGTDQFESNYIFQFSILDDKKFSLMERRAGNNSIYVRSHILELPVFLLLEGESGISQLTVGCVITSPTWMPKWNESKPKMHGVDAQHRFHCKGKRIYYREKHWKKTREECAEAWRYLDPIMMGIYRCIGRRFSPLQQDLVCKYRAQTCNSCRGVLWNTFG